MITNNTLPTGAREVKISGQDCAIYTCGEEGEYKLCLSIKEDGIWRELESLSILKSRTRTSKEIEDEFAQHLRKFNDAVDAFIEKEPVSRIDHVKWLIENKI